MLKRLFAAGLVSALFVATGLSPRAVAEEYKITPDVVYGHKAGMAMTFDVIHPKTPNGAAVLVMMSGGWFSFWVPPESFTHTKQPG
jgi:hypothetical protein